MVIINGDHVALGLTIYVPRLDVIVNDARQECHSFRMDISVSLFFLTPFSLP